MDKTIFEINKNYKCNGKIAAAPSKTPTTIFSKKFEENVIT